MSVTAVPQSSATRLARALWPGASYLLITLLLLRNLVPLIADHLPGHTDGWQNVWNTWWMRYALLDLHTNPFYSDYVYYPLGSSLLFHTYAPLNGFLALPFTVMLGPLITTNLLIIGSFVFTALAAYALGRGLGLSPFAAWLVGLIYSFCNPTRWQYFGGGQADHLATQWMPLYILCLIKATNPPTVATDAPLTQNLKSTIQNQKWLIGAAVFLACCGLTDWQHFVYMGVFTACYAVYLLLREGNWPARLFAIRNLALAVGGALLILAPLLYASIGEALTASYMVRPLEQTVAHSLDLTSYVTPNGVNPIWGGWATAQNFLGNDYGNILGISNAGYLPLLLAIVGLLCYRRRVWQWAAFALIFALLSFGPYLYINDVETFGPHSLPIPMPYSLLLKLPFINISRDPSRFSLTAFLCLAVLAGFGWQAISQRLALWSRLLLARYALAATLALVIIFEFSAVPYDLSSQPISPFFTQLGQDKASYALLEVPVADKFYAEYHQALSFVHHKKIMGGQTARKPCYCFPSQTPVVRWFWDLRLPASNDILTPPPDPASYAPAVLRYFDLRYIVLWKWTLSPADYVTAKSIVAAVLPAATPVADDAAITAYAVPLTATTDLLPASLDDNWGGLEQTSFGPQRWVEDKPVSLKVVNTAPQPRAATLSLKLQAYHQPRTLQVRLCPSYQAAGCTVAPLSQPIKAELKTVSVPIILQPGSNDVWLSSPEPSISPISLDPRSTDPRNLSFAVLNITIK